MAAGGIITGDDDEESPEKDSVAETADNAYYRQGGLFKIIQLITSQEWPTRKLASFRKHLSALADFSLVLIEKIWLDGFSQAQLQRAQDFFDHALDEALYG